MKIAQLQEGIKILMEEKGFANGKDKFMVKVVLLHTEVSELADAIKKGREEDFGQELADIIIRLLNMPLMFPEWGDIWKETTFESIPEVRFQDPWEAMMNLHKEISLLRGVQTDKVGIFKIFAMVKGLSSIMQINLYAECINKMEVNWGRPFRYGTVDEKK
ncbi:hypothetical protein HYG86_16510 [Alkalicella caledoniensis]|uniref:NTP pyrophosphohydrolase MazG-like domain-containing protein n=1 Tax=Alkalicella caledoniensis TaxID=2731377 RepID=A0A7G9WC45_ALKCA|nr:MazG nucleotide pyrophosphohydrolase domain-containing protein [Alkalicella caledoniensis]QNO16257.1 hypothetical protein HYG86_16510 [Alkalicella caledoniensis]